MVTDYIRDAFSLPENFSYYTQKHIYTNFNTRGKSSQSVALGFTYSHSLPFFGNLSYQKQVEKWSEATSINQKRNAPLLYGNF